MRLTSAPAKGAIAAPLFDSMEPQLAELVKEPASGKDWLHEVKFDGYRMRLRISRDSVRLISRHGRDWSRQFRPIAEDAGKIACTNAWIDGELCAIDAKGRVSFQDLQNAVRSRIPARLMFYAFDIPYLNGWECRQPPPRAAALYCLPRC